MQDTAKVAAERYVRRSLSGARFVPRMVLPDNRRRFGFVVWVLFYNRRGPEIESRGTGLSTNTSKTEHGHDHCRWFVLGIDLSVNLKKCECLSSQLILMRPVQEEQCRRTSFRCKWSAEDEDMRKDLSLARGCRPHRDKRNSSISYPHSLFLTPVVLVGQTT